MLETLYLRHVSSNHDYKDEMGIDYPQYNGLREHILIRKLGEEGWQYGGMREIPIPFPSNFMVFQRRSSGGKLVG